MVKAEAALEVTQGMDFCIKLIPTANRVVRRKVIGDILLPQKRDAVKASQVTEKFDLCKR